VKPLRFALALAPVAALAVVVACGDDETPINVGLDGAVSFGIADASAPVDSGGSPTDAAPTEAGPTDAGGDADAATCSIPEGATVTAEIKVNADDYLRLYVNGVLVDDKQTTWPTTDKVVVTLFRSPLRKNVIAVEARNAFNAGGFDRGFVADLGFDAGADAGPDSGVPNIVTDSSWRIIGDATDGGLPDGGLPDGGAAGVPAWFAPGFDDTGWFAPVDQGPHGMAPWGAVFGTSSARWLWSYDSSTAATKAAADVVYFRKAFYLDLAGVARDTPPACP